MVLPAPNAPHPALMASRAGEKEMDVSGQEGPWSSSTGSRDQGPGRSPRGGRTPGGMRPYPGRVAEARHPSLVPRPSAHPPASRCSACSAQDRSIVDPVPQSAGPGIVAMDVFTVETDLVSHPGRAVRDRARIKANTHPGRDQEPGIGMGDSARPQRGDRGAASRRPVSDPRQGY